VNIPKLTQWEPVRITWEDAQSSSGWAKVTKKDTIIKGCVTVGQVHSQTSDALLVVLSWDPINKHANGIIAIPLSGISKLERLSRARTR
jgi:hypothetical protein